MDEAMDAYSRSVSTVARTVTPHVAGVQLARGGGIASAHLRHHGVDSVARCELQ